jgi:uncharacterized protein (UPF0332 family)
MEHNARENAREQAKRGDECLAEARYLMEGGFHNAAVSRAYYAAYHWARALLFLKGAEPKTHRGVSQQLALHYVQPGTLPEETAAALGHLGTFRELSDYDATATFDAERAMAEIQRATMFIAACRPRLT